MLSILVPLPLPVLYIAFSSMKNSREPKRWHSIFCDYVSEKKIELKHTDFFFAICNPNPTLEVNPTEFNEALLLGKCALIWTVFKG